jgi:FixJ family two-component response regulator
MTPAAEATVFVIDDDARMRAAMERLLKSVGLRAESFARPQDFLQRKPPDGPSCLVLDVRLPGMSGLDVQRKLIDSGISIPIIFISGHGDIPMTVKAMKSGAVEFLTKPFRDQDLLDAIQAAIERDRMRREGEKMISNLRTKFETLTPREQEVMACVTGGLMNKQIAAEIGVTENTIKVHRGNVTKKMGARSVAELVRMADILGVRRRTS